MRALLALSGGLDSTFVAWKWLQENPNGTLIVFHVNLRHDKEDRLTKEKQAVNNILNYFRCKGLKNYKYLGNTVFDYGSLPRIMIKDIQIVAMFKAVILKTPQFLDVNTVLLSWHKGEVNREDINRGYRVKAVFTALEVNRQITLEFPIEHKTRAQMVAELPKELLSYVWSCRKPLNGKPCNKCKTCKEYIEEGLQPL